MTTQEFRAFMQLGKDQELIGPCLHDDPTPYVFAPKPATWISFRTELAEGLGVSAPDIRIVGSARFGFSLRPSRNLASFQATSDIDVVVVNAEAFDALWIALLRAAYPRSPITEQIGGWLGKRRNEVYTGWLTPPSIYLDPRIFGDSAKPVLAIKTRWFNTLKRASRHPPRRHETVTGRLYRTWDHAELYHLQSLAALRRSLIE